MEWEQEKVRYSFAKVLRRHGKDFPDGEAFYSHRLGVASRIVVQCGNSLFDLDRRSIYLGGSAEWVLVPLKSVPTTILEIVSTWPKTLGEEVDYVPPRYCKGKALVY